MVSAAHNPYHDNGIKICGADGYKISDQRDLDIEEFVDDGIDESI
jgi:phosphoglucosamine mutase